MSITPLPDLPPEAEGIHLSALDSYLGQPGTLPGVSFWPRARARVTDLVVPNPISHCLARLFLKRFAKGFTEVRPVNSCCPWSWSRKMARLAVRARLGSGRLPTLSTYFSSA